MQSNGQGGRRSNVTPIERPPKPLQPHAGSLTEIELAERLLSDFGDELRFCRALGGWHVWNGCHWQLDDCEKAREFCKAMARSLAKEANALIDVDMFRSAKRASSAAGISAILDIARSTPGIVFAREHADRDPYLLNCRNGTLNLFTGKLKKHDRADLITRVCGANYDADARAPAFAAFLEQVQPDAEVRSYLARLFGYACVGVIREHVLGVLWGDGANGKSVLVDVVLRALGSYAKPGPATLIVASKNSDPHPADIASCTGARLVVVHETNRGATFDAGKVKQLTGGDQLVARKMHKDYYEFLPTHKLLLVSNHRPRCKGSDPALWRRLQLVRFDVVVPEAQRNVRLPEVLQAELPGILLWLVEGAVTWNQRGLDPPPAVRAQTDRYRSAEDVVGTFLSARTSSLPTLRTQFSALYASFEKWCEATGQRLLSTKEFAAELREREIEARRQGAGMMYLGVGLLPDDDVHDV